jgi:hypothetical protein
MDIIGRQVEAGFALEETRGTAESVAEKWARNVTANIVERAEKVVDDATRGRLEDSEGARIVKKWVEGDLQGIVHADTLGYLLYCLYGAVSTQTVSGSVKDHTFSLAQDIQAPTLSIFAKDGGVQQRVFNGGVLSSLEISAVLDNYVRFTASFMARAGASNSDTSSYDTEYDFIGKDVSIKFADSEAGLSGATAIKAKEVTINWDRGLIADHVLGQYTPNDHLAGKMAIEGEFTLNFDATTFKDLYLADTYKYMQIKIEGDADIGSGNHPTITALLNRVQIMDWNREGGNDEVVTQPVSFKAFYNPTDSEQSTVIVRNLTAEYDEPVSD